MFNKNEQLIGSEKTYGHPKILDSLSTMMQGPQTRVLPVYVVSVRDLISQENRCKADTTESRQVPP